MLSFFSAVYHWINEKTLGLGSASQHIVLFILRFYIAGIFLHSGLQKLNDLANTNVLFTYEYNVPVFSPMVATMLSTGIEIILPLLLIFGLFTRLSALILFAFNVVALWSHPALHKGIFSVDMLGPFPSINFPTQGYENHVVWGIALLVIFAFGAGKIAIDYLLGGE